MALVHIAINTVDYICSYREDGKTELLLLVNVAVKFIISRHIQINLHPPISCFAVHHCTTAPLAIPVNRTRCTIQPRFYSSFRIYPLHWNSRASSPSNGMMWQCQ